MRAFFKPFLSSRRYGLWVVLCLLLPVDLPAQEELDVSEAELTEEPIEAVGQAIQIDVSAEEKGTFRRHTRMPGIKNLEYAPVVVNGNILFHLVGIPAVPAKQRARITSQRIEALAEDPEFDPETIRLVEADVVHGFYAGESTRPLFLVVNEDAELEGLDRPVVAEVFKAKISKAIEQYRYERQPEVLRGNIYKALLRSLGLVVTLLLANWLFRMTDRFLEGQLKSRIEKLETKSLSIIQAEQIWRVFRLGLRVLRALIILLIIYVFVTFVLNLFPWTRYFSATALNYILNPLRTMGAAVLDYLPSLIFLILLYYATRYILKLVYQFFGAIERGRITLNTFEADWALPTYRIVRVLVILIALVLAYPYIPGSDSEAFKGISLIFGLLFSLGSTSVISNIVAGYAMTYRRAFQVGDRVKIGDTVGDVLEMRVLVTHILTLKNEEVIVPNSKILNSEVVNYSRMAGRQGLILHTTVGIGYEVPWRQVEAMLLMAAERTRGLSKMPEPFVLQKSLSDFAVNYELNAYCRDEKRSVALYSELHRNIQDVFNEYGVAIMTPAYEADTPEPKLVPREQWYAAPARPEEGGGSSGKV